MSALNDVDELRRQLAAEVLEPYIRYIRFPFYKNLAPFTKVDFTFPITALVGANGTNKSSILRALQGSPENSNLGNYWFSTAVDPIEDAEADKHCFIYGYIHKTTKSIAEVLKTRVERSETSSQKADPDYWEPSRRIVKYHMKKFEITEGNESKTRWDPIKKNVLYLDFRQSLSAFDKYFYSTENPTPSQLRDRKARIRARSVPLQRAIDQGGDTFKYYVNRIVDGKNISLSKAEVESVSHILGRKYESIKWLKHTFFDIEASTCVLFASGLKYTEAFAGSGEFAVARLVVEISRAPRKSLILLDEPEVSLHPGAQEKLIDFLMSQSRTRQQQFVVSTHSPTIIRHLPPDAIKAFVYDAALGKIRLPTQEAAPEEAFFYLGEPLPEKLTIIVEDALATHFVRKALRPKGEAFVRRFDVRFFPGGAETLWTHYLPIFAEEGRADVLILLDGDKRPTEALPDPDTIPPALEREEIKHKLRLSAGSDIHFLTDGGGSGAEAAKRSEAAQDVARRKFVSWAHKYVRYLPGSSNPEAFIWEKMRHTAASSKIASTVAAKDRFVELTKLEMDYANFERVTSAEILQTQIRALATVPSSEPDFAETLIAIEAFAATSQKK